MTNKELAVQLYIASLQAQATVSTNPNFHGNVQTPSVESMVETVRQIAAQLSAIESD